MEPRDRTFPSEEYQRTSFSLHPSPIATNIGAATAAEKSNLDDIKSVLPSIECLEPSRKENWRPRAWHWLQPKVNWAFLSSVSTVLITVWCLRPETREILPMPTFGAYVTIFLTEKNLGRTLRSSVDCVFGASIAVPLAWSLSLIHGSDDVLTTIALFLQSFLWAYIDFPMPAKRVALSTMVMTCLTAHSRPNGVRLEECVGLIGVVGLSSVLAITALLLPLGPQRATSSAVACRKKTAQALKLMIERTITAFLETDSRRHQMALVQLNEICQSAKHHLELLRSLVDDMQWEPWACDSPDSLLLLRMDLRRTRKLFELAEALQRTVTELPFNTCHVAFAKRLQKPLSAVINALETILPPVERMGPVQELSDVLSQLNVTYSQARRELLYPEKCQADQPVGIALQTIAWRMEDLLHMNSFLFTVMHLLAALGPRNAFEQQGIRSGSVVISGAGESPTCDNVVVSDTSWYSGRGRLRTLKSALRGPHIAAWLAHFKTLFKVLRPSWPIKYESNRLRSALRFALAILLAATLSLAPPLRSRFDVEIWAPVEVTFLMFKHAGGSLRQSLLRLQGALLGSIVGYLAVLLTGARSEFLLTAILSMWSFMSCLFRGSASHGYAAIVSAWTAIIVAAAGVAPANGGDATTPSLERMTHTVVGVASLVLVINVIFPIWARDVAQDELIKLLDKFADLHNMLHVSWVAKSQEMQTDIDLLSPENFDPGCPQQLLHDRDDHNMGNRNKVDAAAMENRDALLNDIVRHLDGFRSLVTEACTEPSLWRPEYQVDASRQVAYQLDQILGWLCMFGTYIYDRPPALARVFGDQGPQRWLNEEWVVSLHGTRQLIVSVFSGLRRAIHEERSGGSRFWQQIYLNAMRVEGLEAALSGELRRFLKKYDWILSGTISESQLRILAGVQQDQFLTNFDVLFYNSLVFATRGFVEQLLGCSRAVRRLAVVEAGALEVVNVAEIGALAMQPPIVEDLLKHSTVNPQPEGIPAPTNVDCLKSSGEEMSMILTVLGPDRVGIVHDIARVVFGHGGHIASSRMVKLGTAFAVMLKLSLPPTAATTIEIELRAALKGLQVSLTGVRDETLESMQFQGEVRCVCPEDAPGLLLRLTSVLVECDLNIIALDTEVTPTMNGEGFRMRALVGADVPIDEESLAKRLEGLSEGAGLGMAATFQPVASLSDYCI